MDRRSKVRKELPRLLASARRFDRLVLEYHGTGSKLDAQFISAATPLAIDIACTLAIALRCGLALATMGKVERGSSR